MVFNLNDTSPIYKHIRVNGNLTFDNRTDCHLKAKWIFIRHGKLQIGTKEHPFENKATITLHGERNDETMAFTNSIFMGSKVIANVAKIRIYGKKRAKVMFRLRRPALNKASEFYVETGLDLV